MMAIRHVMLSNKYEHRMTGAGDNQVVAVRLLDDDQIMNQINNVKLALAQSFKDIGLELKVQESWHSRELVCYQRRYHFKGVPCPVGIKTANRAFAGGSDVNSGLNSMVSTAMNGGVGMNQYTAESLIGPLFSYIEVMTNLCHHPNWKQAQKYSLAQYQILPMLNTDFGYLPYISLNGFRYSGHPDGLTESFALLKGVWELHPELRRTIAAAITFEPGKVDDESRMQLNTH